MNYILTIIPDILFVLALAGLASVPLIRMAWKAEVESCRYAMYAVRDQLILLVATGKLSEDSVLFQHYYKRSNDILRLTEKMHLEGLYQALISTQLSEGRVAEHRERLRKVHDILNKADPEVKEVVQSYYSAIIELMMVNSNLFSFVKVVTGHRLKQTLRDKMISWAEKKDPKTAEVYNVVSQERCVLGLT